MGITMIHGHVRNGLASPPARSRIGISLIEVIACTAIVAVLIVPIAAVVKTSGRAITRIESGASTPEKVRAAGTWLRDTLRPCVVHAIEKDRLKFQLPDGNGAAVYLNDHALVMETGSAISKLCTDVDQVRFEPLLTSDGSARRVGLAMTIVARSATTGAVSTTLTTIANSR